MSKFKVASGDRVQIQNDNGFSSMTVESFLHMLNHFETDDSVEDKIDDNSFILIESSLRSGLLWEIIHIDDRPFFYFGNVSEKSALTVGDVKRQLSIYSNVDFIEVLDFYNRKQVLRDFDDAESSIHGGESFLHIMLDDYNISELKLSRSGKLIKSKMLDFDKVRRKVLKARAHPAH